MRLTETTNKYAGAGVKKYIERKAPIRTVGVMYRGKVDKKKKVVEVERLAYGFKVLIVYEVRLRLVVAAKVVPIQEHESKYTLTLVRQAIKNLGEGVLRVLLIDRGFLDGQDLWVLEHRMGIDFVVPAKDNMQISADARGLCRQAQDGESIFKGERAGKKKVDKDGKVKWEGQVSVVGVAELRSYDQYGDEEHVKGANRKGFVGNVLNAVVVTEWQGEGYKVGEEKVFLSSLPVDRPLEVLDLYDLCSLIENTAFRELKQGWFLGSYPKKTEEAVRGHVFLTLVTFTLANAFRTELGQELAQRGVRRQRAEEVQDAVIIFAEEYYAIFDIEEVFILLGVVPSDLLRADPKKVKRKYGLSTAA